VHLGPVAKLRLELVGDPLQEQRLGQLPLLQLEQGVAAVALRHALHRRTERLHRDPGLVLEGDERLDQRCGEHAAEVGDDRLGAQSPAGADRIS